MWHDVLAAPSQERHPSTEESLGGGKGKFWTQGHMRRARSKFENKSVKSCEEWRVLHNSRSLRVEVRVLGTHRHSLEIWSAYNVQSKIKTSLFISSCYKRKPGAWRAHVSLEVGILVDNLRIPSHIISWWHCQRGKSGHGATAWHYPCTYLSCLSFVLSVREYL